MNAPEHPPANPRDAGRPTIRFGPAYSLDPLSERLPDEVLLCEARATRHLRERRAQVYFAAKVLTDIRDDLAVNPRVERGGLLVGHPFRDLSDRATTFTVVVGFIPQPSRQSSAGQFTVTPDMISRARLTLEREFPSRQVVGWYHSHPGHGIFLSGQDMTIVRSIYNAPWQIAFVRDTLRDKEGVFYGPEGTRLDGWLELATVQPDFVLAADLYGLLAEAAPAARDELLARLRGLVAQSPDLSHWRASGRYQDLALLSTADLSAETLGVEELITIHESEAAPPPAADPTTEQRAAQRELEHAISLIESGDVPGGVQILRRLVESHADLPGLRERLALSEEMETREGVENKIKDAKTYIDKGQFGSGLGKLRLLAETHPGWPGLQEAIADGEEKEQKARSRRHGLLNDH